MTAEDRAAELAVCDVGSAGSGGRLGAVVGAVSGAEVASDTPALGVHTSTHSRGVGSHLMTALSVPREWETLTVVPLLDVARIADVRPRDLHTAVHRGQLRLAPERGKYGAAMLTKDEAVNVLTAAVIAVLAGIALATALRVAAAGVTLPEVAA